MSRTDSASRIIKATPEKIYRAFLDEQAMADWRPPQGMEAKIYSFDPREGGGYRMAFVYRDTNHAVRGKTSENADVFEGQFVKLVPNMSIVEDVRFESDDPAFASVMRITTTLTVVAAGTNVTFVCENVPTGIRQEDHQMGMASTLENLAAFVE